MYADGVIGNKGLLEVLGCLTGAVYNYMRAGNQTPYKLQDIIPKAYDYIYPPLSAEEKANQASEALKKFMSIAPNAPPSLFEGK
jgi:hypothetical protein